jgi:intraflagellar transport protein 140
MKALLKSGDTERITFFANVSRQKEIYVMAANYLQSLNWRGNTDIMKNIIGFYTKGRAFETLANFYDTCAKAEIEEYQDYDRAQGALNEALIVLNKIKDVTSTLEDKKKFITRRLELIQKFNNIRGGYAEDREGSIKECKGLLEDRQVDVALRVGDVYAMIITHYIITEDYHQGLAYVDLMKKHIPGVNLKFYIKPQVLEALSNAVGTTHDRNDEETNRQKDEAVSDNDSIEEVVD